MTKIALTGATSMLGVALVEECVKNNIEVLAFAHKGSSKLSRLPKSPLVKIAECDLCDMAAFDVAGEKCDVFYHFAWGSTDKSVRDNPKPQLKNLEYAFDAVDLAARLGCKKFVGAGSQAEYGITPEIISEKTKCDPLSSYGVAKFAAGKLCAKLCTQKDMVCIWPRIFSVYGEYENPASLVSYLINCYLKGETAKVSAGFQNWEYLYQSDAARFLFALGEKCNESKVVALSSLDKRRLKDYVLEVKELTGGKLNVEFAPTSNVPMVTLDSDISTLISDTNVKPEVSFAQGVVKMIEYYKSATPPPCRHAFVTQLSILEHRCIASRFLNIACKHKLNSNYYVGTLSYWRCAS